MSPLLRNEILYRAKTVERLKLSFESSLLTLSLFLLGRSDFFPFAETYCTNERLCSYKRRTTSRNVRNLAFKLTSPVPEYERYIHSGYLRSKLLYNKRPAEEHSRLLPSSNGCECRKPKGYRVRENWRRLNCEEQQVGQCNPDLQNRWIRKRSARSSARSDPFCLPIARLAAEIFT